MPNLRLRVTWWVWTWHQLLGTMNLLFSSSPLIILQICKRSAKQIVHTTFKKNYITLIFISSYIFSQILPRSGYVTTTTAAVQEFTEKDKSVTKRISTSWLFLTFYKKKKKKQQHWHTWSVWILLWWTKSKKLDNLG